MFSKHFLSLYIAIKIKKKIENFLLFTNQINAKTEYWVINSI